MVVGKPACRVYKGQPILGAQAGQVVRWGRIERIKVDDREVQSVDIDSAATNLGLRVDFKVPRKKVRLFVLPQADDAIWG